MLKSIVVAVAALALSACATSPDQIPAQYVSPLTYKDLTCPQLVAELQRTDRQIFVVRGDQGSKSTSDALWVGVALIAPVALIMLASGADRSAELGRLLGERDALYANYKDRDCAPKAAPPAPAQ